MYLAEGSTGPWVTCLQYGLYINNDNPGGIDGIFGAGTKAAVQRFQETNQNYGVGYADGIVGDKTWSRMVAIIRSIQISLNSKYTRGVPQIGTDGYGGPETLNAIKAFQRAHGLYPNGIVSGETYNLILG